MAMTPSDFITIEGARQYNLKNISLRLPRNRLVVITGLSGSGKSTLAFDTLYAEGQRRYVESLSTYARQFLQRLEKPDVDLIDGLSPAIAIEQKSSVHNPRSTVGTVTEIYDYIRLLYARTGTVHCHRCDRPIISVTIDEMVESVMAREEGSRLLILSPVTYDPAEKAATMAGKLTKEGFARVRVDGKIRELDAIGHDSLSNARQIQVVVDRLILKPGIRNRLADSMELAIARSDGQVEVAFVGRSMDDVIDSLRFNERAACVHCGIGYPDLTPASFSFNSPHGACPHCDGLGTTRRFSEEMIVANPRLSLREGAIRIWAHRRSLAFIEFLENLTNAHGTDIYTAYEKLPKAFRTFLMEGSKDLRIPITTYTGGREAKKMQPFEGILSDLSRQYDQAKSTADKRALEQYMADLPCPQCHGTRLRTESRHVRIHGLAIHELTAKPISRLHRFFTRFPEEGRCGAVAEKIVGEITARLSFLNDVGLSYLALDRPAHTLSGGESQRIRLATQIGSRLTGVLYVLDEPSIGLHQRDNQRLLDTLLRMRDMGNSVLVVEHDEDTIFAADHVVDMGPGAGISGGHVVFQGTPSQMCRDDRSLTGRYLSGRMKIDVPRRRRTIGDATAFPLNRVGCIG